MMQLKFRPGEIVTWLERGERARKIAAERAQQRKPKKPRRKRRAKKRPKLVCQRFGDTDIGRFLMVYAPFHYILVMEYGNLARSGLKGNPNYVRAAVIDALAVSSPNKAFRTARFRRALVRYRLHGQWQEHKAKWTLRDALYYARHSYQIFKAFE